MTIEHLDLLDRKLEVLKKHKVFRYSQNGENFTTIEFFPDVDIILNEKKPERLDEIDLMQQRLNKHFDMSKEF